jgi:hypothetical protein
MKQILSWNARMIWRTRIPLTSKIYKHQLIHSIQNSTNQLRQKCRQQRSIKINKEIKSHENILKLYSWKTLIGKILHPKSKINQILTGNIVKK